MCGIAGVLNLGGTTIDPLAVKAMADSLSHRGPDDAGYVFVRRSRHDGHRDGVWVELCDDEFRERNEHLAPLGSEYARRELAACRWDVALAHRRLSVIDLSHYGHQPMSNADRSIWMVYNGEVYNYRELREELAARGHHFRSRTDSEVVLHLYEEEGDSFLERLNGMFALAIWDGRRDRFLMARDRYGVKPLYYHHGPGYLAFGSEIKALLAGGFAARALDAEALPEYFTFQNLLSDRTLFEGVRALPPGHRLVLERGGDEIRADRYWSFRFDGMLSADEMSEAECAEEVASRLRRAVKRQLVADVEVGSYLSGGLDSGSLVGIASGIIPRLYTFTNGFDLSSVTGIESGFDERVQAERMASRFQTEHYEMVIHAGDMAACLPRLVWHLEDLRVGNCYQNYYAAKLASRFVSVCLSGAGGDELFGGYPWRYAAAAAVDSLPAFDDAYYAYWERLVPDRAKPAFFEPGLWDRLKDRLGRPHFDELIRGAPSEVPAGGPPPSRRLTRALWFELNTFLPGILTVEDRVSMCHSLEVRVPFLDNDLVDFALTIPNEYRVGPLGDVGQRGAPMQGRAGKQVLRRAVSSLLPPEVVGERKQGFSAPDGNWYRGPNLQYVKEVLLDRRTLGRGLFQPREIQRIMDEHCAGKANHRLLIWSLLCLEWLQRMLLDAPGIERPSPAARSAAGSVPAVVD
jgi:asparagine synthase (glutamine-hydrolysing)